MSVTPRPDLATLPPYVPGKAVEGAVKLASNEVSAAPLPSVRAAIGEAAAGINRYPDTGSFALVERLADRFGVPTEQLVVGCGSVTLCQMLVQAMCEPGDAVVFGWRSFEAYPILAQVVGAEQIRVPNTPEHRLDVEGMLAAITPRTKVLFACTPNNPTGPALSGQELRKLVDGVPEHVLVVLDEAYREFVDDAAVPDGIEFARKRWADEQHNIVVLRTFSKAYGLAGLRVGYCAAPQPIAEALRKVAVPFAVNVLAQTAAIASLDAEDELMQRCREIIGERERVRRALLEHGYQVPESQANFVWLPLGERARAFEEHAATNKVIVRAFDGDGVRVTIGLPEENELFLEAARSFPG